MAKYSLWISDNYANKFCIPLSRDHQTYKEKVDLYEIDLVTVSLGKEAFIETLKKSNIAPNQFDWNSTYGYIQYQCDHKTYYLPLLFEKDDILIQVLNFQNKYRYHESQNETQILNSFKKRPMPEEFMKILFSLGNYRDVVLNEVKKSPNLLNDENLPKKLVRKIHSCMQSTDYDEQIEYKNDILTEMLSYITFRRLKAMEYGCYVKQPLVNKQPLVEDSDERDPDEEAFLTEYEKRLMYG